MTRNLKSGGLLVALVVLFGLAGTAQAQAPRGGRGQCTDYVWAKLALPATYPNAKKWVTWLPSNGFRQVWLPQFGDVICYQPSALHNIPDPGHVGIVRGVQCVPGGLRLVVRAANWSPQPNPNWFLDYYCNVEDRFSPIPNGDCSVSFWRR